MHEDIKTQNLFHKYCMKIHIRSHIQCIYEGQRQITEVQTLKYHLTYERKIFIRVYTILSFANVAVLILSNTEFLVYWKENFRIKIYEVNLINTI